MGATAIAKLGTGGFNCDLFSGPLKRLPHSRLKKNVSAGLAAFTVEIVVSEGQLMAHAGNSCGCQ